jgi:hypothetical protein
VFGFTGDYSCVYEVDGKLRLNAVGEFIGLNFIWLEVLGNKPKTRTNPLKSLMADYLRTLTGDDSRADLRKATRLLIQLFRGYYDWETEVTVA